MADTKHKNNSKLTIFTLLQSILAAAIGVQSEKNRLRDFNYGKPIYFIVAGLIFVVVFIVVLITIVQMVLLTTPQ
ncbi:MAG: DUF2970 domain-containing protein [Gammaproteobacteria bacterium]|nr:DUF2970 domain-containing protein [Gammaproteobacteria bacterium]